MAYHKNSDIFLYFKDASEDALGDHYNYTLAIYWLQINRVGRLPLWICLERERGDKGGREAMVELYLGTCHMAMSIILASFVVLL
jgi:hypothetical protein